MANFVIGIDFGTDHTSAFCAQVKNGVLGTLVPLHGASIEGEGDGSKLSSYIYPIPESLDDIEYSLGKRAIKLAKQSGVDFLDSVKVLLDDYVLERGSDRSPSSSIEEKRSSRAFKKSDSFVPVTVFFKEIFLRNMRSDNPDLDALCSDGNEIRFVIGFPPGCSKYYAKELLSCVKNGFYIALSEHLGVACTLYLSGALYFEPVLASKSWLDGKLRDKEHCYIIDLGAGTSDLSLVARNGDLIEHKHSFGSSLKALCGGNALDQALSDDVMAYASKKHSVDPYSVFVSTQSTRLAKELIHGGGRSSATIEYIIDKKAYTVDISRLRRKDTELSIEALLADKKSALFAKFSYIKDQISSYYSTCVQNGTKCNKYIFVGGCSAYDELVDYISRELRFFELEQVNPAVEKRGIRLTDACAIALSACLSEDAVSEQVSEDTDDEAIDYLGAGKEYIDSLYFKNEIPELDEYATAGNKYAQYYIAKCIIDGTIISKGESTPKELLEASARQGFVLSQLELGKLLYEGDRSVRDTYNGLWWLETAKANGSRLAEYYLENLPKLDDDEEQDGESDEIDPDVLYKNGDIEGLELFADMGDTHSMYLLGKLYYEQGKNQLALKWLKASADKGDSDAWLMLYEMYKSGKGVPHQSNRQALRCLEESARLNNIYAIYELGEAYLNGDSICKLDEAMAISYFERGAELGDELSMYRLGFCYLGGIGVDKDDKWGIEWMRSASRAGSAEARKYLSDRGLLTDADLPGATDEKIVSTKGNSTSENDALRKEISQIKELLYNLSLAEGDKSVSRVELDELKNDIVKTLSGKLSISNGVSEVEIEKIKADIIEAVNNSGKSASKDTDSHALTAQRLGLSKIKEELGALIEEERKALKRERTQTDDLTKRLNDKQAVTNERLTHILSRLEKMEKPVSDIKSETLQAKKKSESEFNHTRNAIYYLSLLLVVAFASFLMSLVVEGWILIFGFVSLLGVIFFCGNLQKDEDTVPFAFWISMILEIVCFIVTFVRYLVFINN